LMPTTGLKRFGSCRQTHSTLDALLELLDERPLAAADVEHVLVESIAGVHRNFGVYEPAHVVDTQFSIPPLVALTIAGYPVTNGIAMGRLADPVVQDLIRKVEVGHDPEADRIFAAERHIPSTVTVTLKDGTVLQRTRRSPSGDPEHPMKWDDVRAKYRDLSSRVASGTRVTGIERFVDDLERVAHVGEAVAAC
jgi:2-methylcitrate dehydratase PrpD